MTQQDSKRATKTNVRNAETSAPSFKPVALPALAAAVRAAQVQPSLSKVSEPPAILRKEAVLG